MVYACETYAVVAIRLTRIKEDPPIPAADKKLENEPQRVPHAHSLLKGKHNILLETQEQ